ncbi:hypothetical protein KAR91_50900 [Candidatus Pacearchaeota archaeon]|nr:hypothetical protein [Candidatus Pacearchaeota archaeon]
MRCPKCHTEFIPAEVQDEYTRKWGVGYKPDSDQICRVCDEPYGKHFGSMCPRDHKKDGD